MSPHSRGRRSGAAHPACHFNQLRYWRWTSRAAPSARGLDGLGATRRSATAGQAGWNGNIYRGDLHCQSNLSYGEGNPETGLQAERERLDSASITGHAAWPDMPREPGRLGWVMDYPIKARLNGRGAIVVPHHIACPAGYRGIDRDPCTPELSPVVGILSRHGISEFDCAAGPLLHTMGPRVAGGTAVEGLRRGHPFGFAGSTDNHSGFPGCHGEGCLEVFARPLTADALWESVNGRRTCAATGGRIELRFGLNGEGMGRVLPNPPKKEIALRIRGGDFIDCAGIVRNGVPIRRFNGVFPGSTPRRKVMRVKFRLERG